MFGSRCLRWLLFVASFVSWNAMGQEPAVQRDEAGRIVSSTHRVYDSHDRLAVTIEYEYDSAGVVSSRILTSYDREGRVLRTEHYTPDEYLTFVSQRRYDRKGRVRMMRTTQYDENDNVYTDTFRYRYFADKVKIYLNGKLASLDE